MLSLAGGIAESLAAVSAHQSLTFGAHDDLQRAWQALAEVLPPSKVPHAMAATARATAEALAPNAEAAAQIASALYSKRTLNGADLYLIRRRLRLDRSRLEPRPEKLLSHLR